MPNYDGRGNPDAEAGSPVLWVPRVILFPAWVTWEYVLRKPIGAFVTTAERHHWADTVEQIFTFGPQGNNVIYPTALFDFGLLPSVGVYYGGRDFLVKDNELRLHFATWGAPWIAATAADRYTFDKSDNIEVRFDFKRSEDNIFFGIGPDVKTGTQSRYGLERMEASAKYMRRFWGPDNESKLSVKAGAHRISFVSGGCCNDPTVSQLINEGVLAAPPEFGDAYATAFGTLDLQLDTRAPKPAPGSGAYLHAYATPNFDLHEARSWVQYGGTLGGAVDLTGKQRVLKMQLALGFVDQSSGNGIPFTEYQVLGGELMPGFIQGWMTGRSTAAAQIGYTWPVWLGLDGQTRVTFGNAFGEHLEGLGPSKLRMSFDIGLTTSSVRDQGFEILFGLGTETFDQGAGITSVRVAFGSRQGF
ncbi:MAG: hypothetical protein QM831_06480 [Kofleriaceae bacterium]